MRRAHLSRRSTLAVLALFLFCSVCAEAQTMNANSLPPKLQRLFENTKPVCFGRFVIDVPLETIVVPGPQAFGANIETIENGAHSTQKLANTKRGELEAIQHRREPGSLLREFNRGTTPGGWTILFRKDESSTRVMQVWGYLQVKPHAFLYRGSTAADDATEDTEKADLNYIATHLRARAPDEIPPEPGVCLDLGFIDDDIGKYQEMFGIGFRFPSLPDVSLSISSNKDGQTPQPLSIRRKEAERSVLGSIIEGKFRQVKVLREGPRKLYQWEGEEVLFRRPHEEGGTWQEFRYDYPGVRYDKSNPRWDAAMFTGVDHNTAGGKASSLTDEEAIALWDAVMSTIRLRVPGRQ
jgi:hypothetical protein